ncbi:hypothetical protein CTA2_4720 [Colletotrichum tanaceti]|uniref:Uncharacterized protein n=1 Tax=Colletotrichum tanaceti TaxID=1306861 RepID=A0A4U6XG74_9PEZI|nr:hypothetical protein CTA2_4720 [Colletotrichum tanaceti]TKW54765.1 hypothetical protein CTA1_12198 [Colletotrichum tanaceti]
MFKLIVGIVVAYILVPIVLNLFGFGPAGPIGGTLAAAVQSAVHGGAVPAGGLFATLQRAAMTM